MDALGLLVLTGQMIVGLGLLVLWLVAMSLRWPWWAVTLSFAGGVVLLLSAVWSWLTTLTKAEGS